MNILISARKKFPFFRTELAVKLDELPQRPVGEISAAAGELLRDELPALKEEALRTLDGAILTNIRGRPEISQAGESAEESLVVIDGTRPKLDEDPEERLPFRCAITTKFLDFQGKDIRYQIKVRVSSGFELGEHTLRTLCSAPELRFNRLQLGCDYFQPRNFSFLGILLPEVRERIWLQVQNGAPNASAIELEDTDFQGVVSEKFQRKLKIFEWLFGIGLSDPLNAALEAKKL